MRLAHQPGQGQLPAAARRLPWVAAGLLVASVALMTALGLAGPSAAVPRFPSAFPWPPYFTLLRLPETAAAGLAWLAASAGGAGLAAGLVAVRRGWRPRPRRLLIGCLLGVAALMVVPPLGSTDMLDYAMYGRMVTLGRSPYVMTPAQLAASGDPVGAFGPLSWRSVHSVYGPLATVSEWAASVPAGPSMARTVFWLKVEDALAFLAVALALDWMLRGDSAARARGHLLWSVNPLMLWAVIGGGHIDGLAAAAGFLGLACLRRPGAARGLAAGLLIGVAIAIKTPFVFFLLGPAWVARRSPRTLAATAAGAVAVLLPGYLLAGRAAIGAVISRAAGAPDLYQPWRLLTRALAMHNPTRFTDVVALCGFAMLAPVLLWRLPAGSPSPAAVAFAQPVLAVSLAWLICTPQQHPWYDAMIFPLLALMPATRLDWVVVLRALAAALAELPGVAYDFGLRPPWLRSLVDVTVHAVVPVTLVMLVGALVWLCVTGRWVPGGRPPAGGQGAAAGRSLRARAAWASRTGPAALKPAAPEPAECQRCLRAPETAQSRRKR